MLSHSVVSGSLRPLGLQPARLLCPWGSPGKNTGVGLLCPPPEDLPDPGIKPASLASPALGGGFFTTGASLVAQLVKNLPAVRETWVRSLGWEDPLEKRMATHSSILAWEIPWTEEPGGL